MNDKELADRVIALKVGIYLIKGHPMQPDHQYEMLGDKMPPYDFIRDWRVAGALMEKVQYLEMTTDLGMEVYCLNHGFMGKFSGDSMPHIIIQACVEALR